jgi:hypothetical protein
MKLIVERYVAFQWHVHITILLTTTLYRQQQKGEKRNIYIYKGKIERERNC